MSWIGPAIAGVGSLIGGLFGKSSADKANKMSHQLAQQQMHIQQEAMHHGIRWRAEDAKRAGIHPVYALGAGAPTYSPVSTNFSAPSGDAFARAGQNFGRAIDAGLNAPQRQKMREYHAQVMQKKLTNMDLQNEMLKSQIQRMNQAGQAIARPSFSGSRGAAGKLPAGQGALVIDQPLKRTASKDGVIEPGRVVSGGFLKTKTGYTPVKSKDAAERLEDDFVGNLVHAARRYVGPVFGIGKKPFKAPAGKEWIWHPIQMEYRLINKGQRPWWAKSYSPNIRTQHRKAFRKSRDPNRMYGPRGRLP